MIKKFAAKHITYLHVDIAFAEGAAGDFDDQLGDRWDGLQFYPVGEIQQQLLIPN